MIKGIKIKSIMIYFCFGVALISAAFLLSSDTSNAVCRAPDGCVGCHDFIGNTTYIVREAPGTCDRGDFTVGPNMSMGRFIHRTAKLQDGRILLTGGAWKLYDFTATVDIYDPATNTITPAAPMNIKRWSHAQVTLNNGKVLVVGGRDAVTGTTVGSHVLKSAELYDPATNTWTFTGSISVARRSPTITLLNDGRVLVAGGGDRASSTVTLPLSIAEIYDPATGTFSVVGNMTTPRNAHSATLLNDGTVLITGGTVGISTVWPTTLAEIFNPADNSFTAVGPSLFPHLAQVGVKMRDGRVLIPGSYYNDQHNTERGNISPECEIYDPATRTFSATGSMYKKRVDVGGQLLLDGNVLISGGVSTDLQRRWPTMFQTSSEVYDPKTGIWLLSGLMRDGRDEFSGIQFDDGRIFVSGGFTKVGTLPSAVLDTTEIYTPGLISQIRGLINVINDLPDSALKSGTGSRGALLTNVKDVGKYLGVSFEDMDLWAQNKSEYDGKDIGENPGGYDTKHVVNNNGVYHRPGFRYPEVNCAGCHGENLRGDIGPSCYTCHGPKWVAKTTPVDYNKALDQANKLLSRMDGCSGKVQTDDLIVDCTQQKYVGGVLNVLRGSIQKILTPNQIPTVSVTATPTSGLEPLAVAFTSTASDTDGTIDAYYWQFGDGKTSNIANPTHTYSCDGTYIATLRVTDNAGGSAQASVTITVDPASSTLTYNCDVQPVFDHYCVGCHGSFGGVTLTSCATTATPGPNGPNIVPGDAAASLLYQEIASGDMPPSGARVPADAVARIGAWIDSLDPLDPNYCD
ncbi:MAG: PKD domain-containing protein [Candidatus Schekmanbacteria bacterium]|nr:PKD domain-containing protein [Candidatus Schekmanbacteria bacterium]